MSDLGDWESFSASESDDPEAESTSPDETESETTDAADAPEPTSNESFEPADDDGFERLDAEPVGSDRGIGTLYASEGLKISEEEGETCVRAYVTTENRQSVRIGKYLLVPYPDGEHLFCRVAAVEYAQEFHNDDATEIHARRAMRRDRFEERDYKFLASLEPIAVLYDDDGELKRRMTDRVPKPGAVVAEATDTERIKTGLKIPDDGVFLGHLSVGGEKVRTAAEPPTIDYRVKDDYAEGDPLVFRHTLIAGGTGSGKTHAAKNVLRQYLHEDRAYPIETGSSRTVRAAVVQFDPQDEYAQMHDDNPDVTREDERAWNREGIAHGGHDDTVAFVPKVGNGTYAADHHRAEQVEFTIPFSMVRGRPWLVAGSGLNDNQYGALDRLIRDFFRENNNGTYAEFVNYVQDPEREHYLTEETGQIHEATYRAVKRRISNSTFRDVFDQDARPLTDQITEFVRPGGLSVVPTYHINDTRAKETIVLAVSSLLIDQKLSNDPHYERIKDTPLVVGMDEAHNFLADAESVQARKVISKFTEAAKQGRKERLGLFLITQDPQDVAEPVFKQVNTTVVLNLGDDDAIKSVNIPSNLEGKVPYMEKGQMVVYSPDNSEPVELIGLSKCLTRHGRD